MIKNSLDLFIWVRYSPFKEVKEPGRTENCWPFAEAALAPALLIGQPRGARGRAAALSSLVLFGPL